MFHEAYQSTEDDAALVSVEATALAGPSEDIDAIIALFKRYARAVRDGAGMTISSLFHPKAVIYSALRHTPQAIGPGELAYILNEFIAASAQDMTVHIRSIEVRGHYAVVMTEGRRAHSFDYCGIFTAVKTDDRWLIGAEATTGLPAGTLQR